MRIIVILIGLLFAAIGLGFWIVPEQAAQGFHLQPLGGAGLVTLRADLGGMFLGLAVLIWIGVWKRLTWALLAAALIVFAALLGRLIGLVAGQGADVPSFAIEILASLVLFLYARRVQAAAEVPWTTRRIVIAGGVAAVLIVSIAAVANNAKFQQAVFDRAARQLIRPESMELLGDDALRVAICGSSGPPPSPTRAKACVAVLAGGKFYVVDTGPESVENLVQWGIPLARIGGVMITHFHSDHIGDLGELNLQSWVQGRPMPLPVYGGPGIDQVVDGFNQAYRLDQGYRTAHHGDRVVPAETWPLVAHLVEPRGEKQPRTATVVDDGDMKVTAIEVDHGPVRPAFAYRFDYKGRSVVISGDVQPYPPLAVGAEGADILVTEALARPMIETLERTAAAAGRDRLAAIMHDIQGYHISPTEVAELSNQAHVRLLVFYHLLPAPDNALTRGLFTQGVREARKGEWDLAWDGSLYTLPIGSEEVRVGRIGE